MSKKYISDLKVNEQVNSFFMLKKKDLKLTKHDKPYLALELLDKTGKIEGRLWDEAEKYNEFVEVGDIVKVVGGVDKFREDRQLKVNSIHKADDRDFVFEDMVRVVEGKDEIFSKVITYLDSIENDCLKRLVESF